ncbi:MAG: hypothetical protein P8Y69_05985 [Gammaproteobacteria bacterium]
MDEGGNQRIAYYNGQYLPEDQVRIPFRDRGFLLGDGVFDMTRTFGGRIFRIGEHVERLFRSLRALRIDPGRGADGRDQRGGAAAQPALSRRGVRLLGGAADIAGTRRSR